MKILRVPIVYLKGQRVFYNFIYDKENKSLECVFQTHIVKEQYRIRTKGEVLDTEGYDVIQNLTIDLNEYAGGMYDVVMTASPDGQYTVGVFPSLRNFVWNNGLPSDTRGQQLVNWKNINVMTFAVEKDASDINISLYSPSDKVESEDFEDVLCDPSVREWVGLTYELTKYSEVAKKVYKTYILKSELFNDYDFKSSLGYLEAQIDVMTRFILKKYADDKDKETKELLDFMKLSDAKDVSLLDLTPVSDLSNYSIATKKQFRALQKEYKERSKK